MKERMIRVIVCLPVILALSCVFLLWREGGKTGMIVYAQTAALSGEAETEGAQLPASVAYHLKKARKDAQQYYYYAAIKRLSSIQNYEQYEPVTEAISHYQDLMNQCREYPLDQITHIFFHTLIYDTGKAFDSDEDADGYNQVMTTVSEFKWIINSLYRKGYVLVSLHDMAQVDENGVMKPGRIMLPEGKTPIVISQDDVSYYHYMDGDGFASRLVLDGDGKVKCEYVNDDGSVMTGDFDLVPILDDFIELHPDFSYHGRKGILAMTGYNGVLGYRTDEAYKTGANLQDDQRAFLAQHPDFDFDAEVSQARAVAEAMKANGWEFASHTWGHLNATTSSWETLAKDNERWMKNVAPILGSTDMIIFAFGADIGDWNPYAGDNPKYSYYKNAGYHYYCNVDSNQYWLQLTDSFLRMGRRNADGYRMYYNPEMLSDLFDVDAVWDRSRPVPVSAMGVQY